MTMEWTKCSNPCKCVTEDEDDSCALPNRPRMCLIFITHFLMALHCRTAPPSVWINTFLHALEMTYVVWPKN